MKMGLSHMRGVLILVAAVFVIGIGVITQGQGSEDELVSSSKTLVPDTETKAVGTAYTIPILSLPFNILDTHKLDGEVNPLGVVRSSKDEGAIGHSGIDIPLVQGADILAVADGRIVLLELAGDPWGGMKIFHLLYETGDGEGWGFLYEHVTPRESLVVGSVIKRGDVLATKTAPKEFTAHFQLSSLFNEFKYITDVQCWPNYLDSGGYATLDSWWKEYRESDHLVNSWNTTIEEGKYPFRGLLDRVQYPNGPQLCYSRGTDVR